LVFACAACAFLFANNAIAFPGERVPYRAAHVAHRVVYGADRHIVTASETSNCSAHAALISTVATALCRRD
jgi:hypothetical protein